MKKLKILYLVSTLKKCGPINILYGIIKGLDRDRFDIFIICLSKEGKNSMADHFLAMNTQIINLNNDRIKGIIRNKTAVQSFVDKHKVDISHSHGLRADSINSRLKNVIRFNTIHNFPGEDYLLQFGKLKGALMEMKHKKAIDQIDFPISCAKSIAEKFKTSYNIHSSWIQNGIEISEYDIAKLDKQVLKKKLGLPIDKILFIVSGSMIPRKNPKLIIETFNRFKQKSVALIFIGGGKLNKILSENNQNKNICFFNHVFNVAEYLKSSDFYISASSSEGLPNSVLEAMSSGLPTILSDISSHKEIVGNHYPYLFKENDSDDLLKKMRQIIEDDYETLSQAGLNMVKAKFSSVLMSGCYQTKYLEKCQDLES